MSTINSLLSSQAASSTYSLPRTQQQSYGQKEDTNSQQLHGQVGFSDYRLGGLPTWSELDTSAELGEIPKVNETSEKIGIELDESDLLITERLTSKIIAEIKENGFDIKGAIETSRADLFEDLLAEELTKGNVVGAIDIARAKMPGDMTDAELKIMLEEILKKGHLNGEPLSGEVEKTLQEIVNAMDANTDAALNKVLTENKTEAANDSFIKGTPASGEAPSTGTAASGASKTETPSIGTATSGANKDYTREESYRIEALAFTKTQFEKGNDLENNKEAREMFDTRLAENMAGKNRNDRSVNLMHYIA